MVGSELVGEVDGDKVGSEVVGEVDGDKVGSELVGDAVTGGRHADIASP